MSRRNSTESINENEFSFFLEQVSTDVAYLSNPITQIAVNMRGRSDKKEYEKDENDIIDKLERFPPSDSKFFAFLPYVLSFSTNNLEYVFGIMDHFFPAVTGLELTDVDVKTSVLSHLPSIKTSNLEITAIVGYFSEVMFTIYLHELLKLIRYFPELISVRILDRIFFRPNYQAFGSLSSRILQATLHLYDPFLTSICDSHFNLVYERFIQSLPNKKSPSIDCIQFFTAIRGLKVVSQQNSPIQKELTTITSTIKVFKRATEVINEFSITMSKIIPQLCPNYAKDFYKIITKKMELLLQTPALITSCLRLVAGCYYVNPPHHSDKKYQNLVKSFLIVKSYNPQKMEIVLDFMITLIKPSIACEINKNNFGLHLLKEIYKPLLSQSLVCLDKKATNLLVLVALVDFNFWITDILPFIFKINQQNLPIAYQAIHQLLNPLYYKDLDRSPKNLQAILKQLEESIVWYLESQPLQHSEVSFSFIPFEQLLPFFQTNRDKLSSINMPYEILAFLKSLEKINPIRQLQRARFTDSENSCTISLNQWNDFFDIYHTSFGRFQDEIRLHMKKDSEPPKLMEINLMPLIPILLYYYISPNSPYPGDFVKCTSILLQWIISDDLFVAAASSLVFESLFYTFPAFAYLFFKELVMFYSSHLSLSCEQLNRFYLLFYHIITANSIQYIMKEKAQDVIVFIDELSLTALLSPFPESRAIGLDLLESTRSFLPYTDEKSQSLLKFIENYSTTIEQKVLGALLTEYSTSSHISSPEHRLPLIQLRTAALSPFILLWRFFIVEISNQLIDSSLIPLLVSLRSLFIQHLSFVNNSNDLTNYLTDVQTNDFFMFSNILIFLFSTSTELVTNCSQSERNSWLSQVNQIDNIIKSTSHILPIVKEEQQPSISFAFISIHVSSIKETILKLCFLIEANKYIFTVTILATVLRHIAMRNDFGDYVCKMLAKGDTNHIFRFFDTNLSKVQLKESCQLLTPMAHFFIFRAQYFKYIHQSNLKKPLSPIPRCAMTIEVNEGVISPFVSKVELFEQLVKWASSKEEKPFLQNFLLSARIALSHLASLTQFYEVSEQITPHFINCCTQIGKHQNGFLKHFLTNHFQIALPFFIQEILNQPVENGTYYFKALSDQFIAVSAKDSLMIYSHDPSTQTSGSNGSILSSEDVEYTTNIYLETGTMIFIPLLFLLHNDFHIRQSAIAMLLNIAPILSLIHYDCDKEITKEMLAKIRKTYFAMSAQSETIRLASIIKLSAALAKVFSYATEQLLFRAFSALHNLRFTKRMQLLEILNPWMTNININLKHGLLLSSKSRFFMYYTPYSFVKKLCYTMKQIYEEKMQWSEEICHFVDGFVLHGGTRENNLSFIISVIMDQASKKTEIHEFAIQLITYLARISHKTINMVVPLLSYGQWYFYHVQLGKFEEIADMDNYLHSGREKTEKESKTNDSYGLSTQFALSCMKSLLRDNMMSIYGDHLDIILSFCLTHLHQKMAFDLLFDVVLALEISYDSGIPGSIRNLHELLSQIASIPYDSIHFVIESEEKDPLRALQKRTVSLCQLLESFKCVINEWPNEQADDTIAKNFLIWGVSCGDLKIAAKSLNMFSTTFNTSDMTIMNTIVESMCLVMRCLISSQYDEGATLRVAEYITAALNALIMVVETNELNNQTNVLFWLTNSILRMNGLFFENIVEAALKLFNSLIDHHGFNIIDDFDTQFIDMKEILINVFITVKNTQLMYAFYNHVLLLPAKLLAKDGNFSIYIIAMAPLLCCSISSPQGLANIVTLDEYQASMAKLVKLANNPQITSLFERINKDHDDKQRDFAFYLMGSLKSIATNADFEAGSLIFSEMIDIHYAFPVDCFYDLGTAILSVCPTNYVIMNLSPLTREVILNQTSGIVESKILYLQTISSHSASFTLIKNKTSEFDINNKKWEPIIHRIQSFAQKTLHKVYQPSERSYTVRFDSIEYFPPMLPFEEHFLHQEIIEEVTNMCRRIQVDPQSNWASSLYYSKEYSEHKAKKEELNLKLDLPFSAILASLVEAVIDEDESCTSTNTKQSDNYIASAASAPTIKPKETLYETNPENGQIIIKKEAFLESFDKVQGIAQLRNGFKLDVPDPLHRL